MGAGRRQAKIPGSEIPQDCGDQQREHHRKTGAASDLKDQFDRQQRDDAERNRAARQQDSEKIEKSRPHDGEFRRHGVGIDHGSDRVRRVMEAVDELEAERDQECNEQQQIGQISRDLGARGVDIDIDAVGDEQ